MPLYPDPADLEAVAVHGPVAVLAGLVPVQWVRFGLVWGWWVGMLSLLVGVVPRGNGAYDLARPLVRGVLMFVCGLMFWGWVNGGPHGPGPAFGFIVGTLIPIYALSGR